MRRITILLLTLLAALPALALQKNVASQKVLLYSYTKTTGAPVADDPTAWTIMVSVDGAAAAAAVNDGTSAAVTNQTGFNVLVLDQTETNGDVISITATTATENVLIEPVVLYTVAAVPAVNVTQIEGADPTDTILAAVVDDATRIDASALNTLSGHDPGATIGTGTSTHSAADVWAVETRQLTGTQTFNLTGNITGSLSGSVGTLTTWHQNVLDWGNGERLDLILDIIAVDVAGLDGDAMRGTNSAALAATALTTAVWTGTKAGYLDAAISGVTAPSAAAVADAVLDELVTEHTIENSVGAKLASAAAAGDPCATTVPGAYGAGTLGYLVGTYLNASSAAIKAKTDLISATSITVASPVAASGEVTIFRGDDYADADGRALTFTVANYSGPSLAGATTTMALISKANYERGLQTSALSVTATVTGTTTLTIKVDLTAAQTAALASNPSLIYTYYYQVRSTTAAPASRKITLAQDKLIVRPRIAE